MPKIFFGNPERVVDNETSWWHISVGIQSRKPWQSELLPNCRIFAEFPDLQAETRLAWQGGIEPIEECNLQYGESYRKVPVVIRSGVGDLYLTGAPGRLRRIPLPGRTARMTDMNSLYYSREPFVDVPPGVHSIRFRLVSGSELILSDTFLLVVPPQSGDNENFILRSVLAAEIKA